MVGASAITESGDDAGARSGRRSARPISTPSYSPMCPTRRACATGRLVSCDRVRIGSRTGACQDRRAVRLVSVTVTTSSRSSRSEVVAADPADAASSRYGPEGDAGPSSGARPTMAGRAVLTAHRCRTRPSTRTAIGQASGADRRRLSRVPCRGQVGTPPRSVGGGWPPVRAGPKLGQSGSGQRHCRPSTGFGPGAGDRRLTRRAARARCRRRRDRRVRRWTPRRPG